MKCGAMFTKVMDRDLCKYCSRYSSKDEKEVRRAIEQIIGNGTGMLVNDRTTISPYELDIVVPSLKLAVEYNGIHWHNENAVDKHYH